MRKLIICFIAVISVFNLSILIENNNELSISIEYLRNASAQIIGESGGGGVPACVDAGKPWGSKYVGYLDHYCYDSEGKMCGEEHECSYVGLDKFNCTQICCN